MAGRMRRKTIVCFTDPAGDMAFTNGYEGWPVYKDEADQWPRVDVNASVYVIVHEQSGREVLIPWDRILTITTEPIPATNSGIEEIPF